MRRGFTLVEIVTVLAILAALAGVSFPLLRIAYIRNNLGIAAEQTEQMLRRARILSQSGDRGAWGVHAPSGTLYQGTSFEERDTNLDEHFPVPGSIVISGVTDVSFSPLYGEPSATGAVILTATTGDSLAIDIFNNALGAPKIVSSIAEAFVKVEYPRIKNTGQGSATPTVHVGPAGTTYTESEWIPLTTNGQPIIDGSYSLAGNGIALERGDGWLRFFAFGGIPLFQGMEIVDARITLLRGDVLSLENDDWPNSTEFPFDGYVYDWPIGDEITKENSTTVLFQTRVTNESDSFLLNWRATEYGWR